MALHRIRFPHSEVPTTIAPGVERSCNGADFLPSVARLKKGFLKSRHTFAKHPASRPESQSTALAETKRPADLFGSSHHRKKPPSSRTRGSLQTIHRCPPPAESPAASARSQCSFSFPEQESKSSFTARIHSISASANFAASRIPKPELRVEFALRTCSRCTQRIVCKSDSLNIGTQTWLQSITAGRLLKFFVSVTCTGSSLQKSQNRDVRFPSL